MRIEEIYKSVEREFKTVNQLISSQLSSDVPLVEKIGQYIVESGGKRMRPLMVLLVNQAIRDSQAKNLDSDLSNTNSLSTTDIKDKHCTLATVIEFLHTATLLHDDVVDASSMRRGNLTANANWGNAPSVLVGDFLYSRAFQMMVDMGNLPVMNVLSNATNVIAEGEVLQLMNCKNPDVSEEAYFKVIKNKTAMLFEAASHSAAILSHASDELIEAMKEFGLQVGLAFQLVDDMLDYIGDAQTMGKNVGDDLAEGKPTLPLIFAMKHGTEKESQMIRKAIRSGDTSHLEEICVAVKRSGALDYTEQAANKAFNKACDCLELLADSPSKNALFGLAKLTIERNK